ncbi:hypothetical protein GBF38_000848 [Nibea albiflora]|nr:hypothetical protein GBF38_000848 [Nibea albiflora]
MDSTDSSTKRRSAWSKTSCSPQRLNDVWQATWSPWWHAGPEEDGATAGGDFEAFPGAEGDRLDWWSHWRSSPPGLVEALGSLIEAALKPHISTLGLQANQPSHGGQAAGGLLSGFSILGLTTSTFPSGRLSGLDERSLAAAAFPTALSISVQAAAFRGRRRRLSVSLTRFGLDPTTQ